jgi:uncharacterized protein YbjT (DUF2867 family)
MNSDAIDGSAPQKVFAVVGATGRQGGATARALLAAGAGVHALLRDPNSATALDLAERGAVITVGDLDDGTSLRAAFTGVDGIFAMTTYAGERGTDGEVTHGMAIADAAIDAGVTHVVYSSVGGAERHTGIPHFESKRRVEEYLTSLDLSATFVRPTFFMENFLRAKPQIDNGTLVMRMPLPADLAMQMIATDDIGAIAAVALLDPGAVIGGSIEIAGDELTGEQFAAAHGEHAGLPARYEPLPLEVLADNPDQHAMFAWFARPPSYQADFAATRNLVPSVMTLRAWLGRLPAEASTP